MILSWTLLLFRLFSCNFLRGLYIFSFCTDYLISDKRFTLLIKKNKKRKKRIILSHYKIVVVSLIVWLLCLYIDLGGLIVHVIVMFCKRDCSLFLLVLTGVFLLFLFVSNTKIMQKGLQFGSCFAKILRLDFILVNSVY